MKLVKSIILFLLIVILTFIIFEIIFTFFGLNQLDQNARLLIIFFGEMIIGSITTQFIIAKYWL